jgi:hypothetical protein
VTRALNRTTADLSSYPDLVVIYLGMRVNEPRGVRTLMSFGPKIRKSVEAQPDGTNWAITTPARLTATPPAAELPAEIYGAPDPAIAAPRPTISTTARSPHHQVECSARSLIHSVQTTRTWVTGPATVAGAGDP